MWGETGRYTSFSRGWPGLGLGPGILVNNVPAEGAPSLRFLQGRVRCCRHNALLYINPVAHAFVVPALWRVCKGRGTHRGGDSKEIKSPGRVAHISDPRCIPQKGWVPHVSRPLRDAGILSAAEAPRRRAPTRFAVFKARAFLLPASRDLPDSQLGLLRFLHRLFPQLSTTKVPFGVTNNLC